MGWSEAAIDSSTIAQIAQGCGDLYQAIKSLAENPPKSLSDLAQSLGTLGTAFRGLINLIEGLTHSASVPVEFKRFGQELVEQLITDYLWGYHPIAFRVCVLLTLVRVREELEWTVHNGEVIRVPDRQPRFELGRLADLLSDPVGTLKLEYLPRGLGDGDAADAAADKLFPAVAALLGSVKGLAASYGISGPLRDGLDWGAFGNKVIPHMLCVYTRPGAFLVVNDGSFTEVSFGATLALASPDRLAGSNPALVVAPFGSFEAAFPVGGGWQLDIALGGTTFPAFAIGPGGFELLEAGSVTSIKGHIGAEKSGQVEGAPAWQVGSDTGTRLQISSLSLGVDMSLEGADADIGFLIKIGQSALVIAPGDGDGFLQKVLPKDGFKIDFNLAFGWSKSHGVYFDGGAGFEVTLPVHRTLFDIIEIETVSIALAISKEGLRPAVATTINVHIGPVAATVERMGLSANLAFKEGNLGPVDLSVGFKPPNGLGIVINAGPVTGGGFISFDFENQRYAGVLQLKLYSIGITAIGLLDTKLPGGQSGFSFLIIIAVEFTPIQLGFGFTLNGVGGLAGINRTIVTQVLRDGLRQKALDSILFPPEPVKRATQLISDLRRVFPPAENRYVFGPMLKIGWATFLEASLGVILEVPSPVRIIILGQLDVLMPERHAPIVELHLDVLGIIDFGEKLFSLDASLYDSRVALFNISGDMALRLSWGDNPSFALSVGGFNPHFQPPPAFPTLRRLCISLGYEDNPRLALEAYFAVTSNSFQFGAALSLYAALGPLEIKGFMGFDALFIFEPFSFIIDFQASLELSIWGFKLLGIYVTATLSGPTPYHIIGEAKVSILFFEVSAHIDFTFGDEKHESVPGADPWPLLEAAVEDQRNWSASLPPASVAAVTLAAPEGNQAPVLVDPMGGITLRQKVVPFNQRLTKFGEAAPKVHDLFQLEEVKLGSSSLRLPDPELNLVSDHFAPGQFREMTDAEKISSPSFVDLPSGFTLASDALTVGGGMETRVEYTTKLIDTKNKTSVDAGTHPVSGATLLQMARRGAQGSELAMAGLSKYAPSPADPKLVALAEEQFVVAQKADLKMRADITHPVSKGLAQLALADYLSRKPSEREMLQVIPLAESKEAA
ncbi:MAG TPA: DUF6603 domain-containing protein [Blastocatellia bacterium]|nr:DUF6603 domain-containing protein [Blastocatellia bacterium]